LGEIEKDIIWLVKHNPGLSDKELSEAIQGRGASSKYINQNCQSLKTQGVLYRKKREDGLIGNWLKENDHTIQLVNQVEMKSQSEDVSEKKIKQILEKYLAERGWTPEIDWSASHGIDVQARRGDEHWIIQVKGAGTFHSILINKFLIVLGEIVQRMDDPKIRYSIALPDIEEFRRLWERVPALAKSRLQISVLFVNLTGNKVEEA
jgi:hypothetical protein